MWLVMPFGFYSVVEKPWDKATGTLTVRARVRSDLDTLRQKYLPDMSATSEDPKADYRYRATAPRGSVQKAMSAMVADLSYSNLKDEVANVQGDARASTYHAVWAALRRLQRPQIPPGTPIIYASIGRRPDVLDDSDDDDPA